MVQLIVNVQEPEQLTEYFRPPAVSGTDQIETAETDKGN